MLLIVLLIIPIVQYAQQIYDMNAKLLKWESLRTEYNRLTRGDREGYRVKIHFTVNKKEAQAVFEQAQTSFPDQGVYLIYEVPNFSVVFGDFETKMQAAGWMAENKSKFPTAFIVQSRINSCRNRALPIEAEPH